MRCIPFQDQRRENPQESFISAVRLQIAVNEVKVCRKITLKGLYGEQTRLHSFVDYFSAKLAALVENLPEDKKGEPR